MGPKGAGKSSFDLIEPEKIKNIDGLKKDSVVLDLACGKGLYSLFLSEIVGENGLVYATDLWEEGLELLGKEAEKKGISNILILQGDATKGIDIDDNSVDVCLMATVLHDFEEMGKSSEVLNHVKNVLSVSGILAVIEFKKIDGPPGPPVSIRLTESETEKLVQDNGFKKIKTSEIGEYNYLTVFKSV